MSRLRSTSSPIFPNLQSIRWCDSTGAFGDLIIFMHERVRNFQLYDSGWMDILAAQFLVEAVQARMPDLSVSIEALQSYVGPLVELLGSLPNLQTVQLPAFADISDIVNYVATSRTIKHLSFTETHLVDNTTGVEIMGSGGRDVFTKMEGFSICSASYLPIATFLNNHSFRALRTLGVETNMIEDILSTRQIFCAVSHSCPLSEFVKISYTDRAIDNHEGQLPQRDAISFSDFSYILNFGRVMRFEFSHPYALDLTDIDLFQIAEAWPNLHTIDLSPAPKAIGNIRKPSLFSICFLFAYCLQIRCIGLLFDTTNHTVPFAWIPNSPKSTIRWCGPLSERLDVGRSALREEDVMEVTDTLAHILAPNCRIKFCRSFDDANVWEGVAKWTPSLANLVAAVRSRDYIIYSLGNQLHSAKASVEILKQEQQRESTKSGESDMTKSHLAQTSQ
ncbi:hypothetical protein L218DRAFT_625080 [Marasmius fiardii PR-910]|nr:hypothetical protein L218DRAFT_625080 [Marasmius fiardii PR-910]